MLISLRRYTVMMFSQTLGDAFGEESTRSFPLASTTSRTSSQILQNHLRQSLRRSSPNTTNLRSFPEHHLSRHGVYLVLGRDVLRLVDIHADERCLSLESFR
jgi:hypothetical protein